MFTRICTVLVVTLLTATTLAQTPQKEGTAIVAGIVTLKGEPARNVLVVLQASGTYQQNQSPRVKTDETGRFRFERIKAGRYVLGAVAPGYSAPNENMYGAQGKSITVAEGETLDTLEIPLRFGAIITGRITDSRGNPIVGEGVEVARLNDQGKPERVWLGPNGMFRATDDRGIYRIFGLPAGQYLVSMGFEQRPNSITMTSVRVLYPKTYHPGASTIADAKIVKVSEGQEATGVDITVGATKRNYDVAERLTYAESGQPVAGVEIGYGVVASGGNRVGPTANNDFKTNADGEFRLQNILPGRYVAFAEPESGDTWYSEPVRFEIGESDVEGLELKLHRGGTISGVAVIEGTTDPAVLAKLTALQFNTFVSGTDLVAPGFRNRIAPAANGSFVAKGLAPGRAVFSLGYIEALSAFTILRVERDGVPQPEGIDIGAGEQISGVRIVIGYGKAVLRGQVQVVGGVLPNSIQLRAYVRQAGSRMSLRNSDTVDARGQFRIENLPLGEYELVLSASYRGGEPPPEYEELKRLLTDFKQRVTVGDGEAVVNVPLDLSRKGGNQ